MFINQINNSLTNIFNEELKIYIQICNNNYLNVNKQNFNNISLSEISKNQARAIIKNSTKRNVKLNLPSAKKTEISKKEWNSFNLNLIFKNFKVC